MDQLSFRNVWISMAIVMPIMAVGLVVLRNDPDAKGFLVLVAIFTAIFLRHALDRRELRRRGIEPPRLRLGIKQGTPRPRDDAEGHRAGRAPR